MPATPPPDAQWLNASTSDLKRRLAITLEHTADVLDQSARLADDHAARRARHGQAAEHATERGHALRARRAAERARTNAARLTRPATPDHDDLDVLLSPEPHAPTQPT